MKGNKPMEAPVTSKIFAAVILVAASVILSLVAYIAARVLVPGHGFTSSGYWTCLGFVTVFTVAVSAFMSIISA